MGFLIILLYWGYIFLKIAGALVELRGGEKYKNLCKKNCECYFARLCHSIELYKHLASGLCIAVNLEGTFMVP